MRNYLLFGALACCFWLINIPLWAQKKGLQDVVELKNGWVLRGKILSMPTDSVLEIETEGRNLFVFKRTEVITETRERMRPPRFRYQAAGYLNITEFGLLRGKKVTAEQGTDIKANEYFTFQTYNGYQFNRWLGAGLTVGVDPVPGMTLMPVAVGLRGDLTNTRVRLYYSLDTGYALDWLSNPDQAHNIDGGFMINPALGVKIPLSPFSAFVINIGFKSQRASSTRLDSWWGGTGITEQEYKFKRATLRIGLSF